MSHEDFAPAMTHNKLVHQHISRYRTPKAGWNRKSDIYMDLILDP